MRVELLIENLSPYLPAIAKALPSHSPVPVLLNILLDATESGLFISATDLDLGIRVRIPAKVDAVGAVTVPGKQFLEIVNSLPKGRVSITQEKETVTIDSAGGKIMLQTIPREEFPNLFEEKGERVYAFTRDELKDMFQKLVFATSLDGARAELTGIYINQKDEYVDCVATDGYRLSLKRLMGDSVLEVGSGIIISGKFVQEALALTAEKTEMYVHAMANQVILEAEDLVLVGRLISGNFPNYERVIPESGSTKITIDREELQKAIKLVSVFARESANIVRVKIEDKTLQLFSRSSGVGEGDISIAVEQTGDDTEIAFNVKYLQDLLRVTDEKRIILELNGPQDASLFTLEKDTEFLHVIMPVRVQE